MTLRVLLIAVLLAVCVVQAGDRLRVSLPGLVATAPADIWVTIRLDPEAGDQAMIFSVIGDPGEVRSSTWALDGANGWHIKQDLTKALGPGCYQVFAEIHNAAHLIAVAHSPMLTVLGREGNPCED